MPHPLPLTSNILLFFAISFSAYRPRTRGADSRPAHGPVLGKRVGVGPQDVVEDLDPRRGAERLIDRDEVTVHAAGRADFVRDDESVEHDIIRRDLDDGDVADVGRGLDDALSQGVVAVARRHDKTLLAHAGRRAIEREGFVDDDPLVVQPRRHVDRAAGYEVDTLLNAADSPHLRAIVVDVERREIALEAGTSAPVRPRVEPRRIVRAGSVVGLRTDGCGAVRSPPVARGVHGLRHRRVHPQPIVHRPTQVVVRDRHPLGGDDMEVDGDRRVAGVLNQVPRDRDVLSLDVDPLEDGIAQIVVG